MISKHPNAFSVNRRTLLTMGAALAGATPLLRAPAFAASDPKVIEGAKKEGAVSL